MNFAQTWYHSDFSFYIDWGENITYSIDVRQSDYNLLASGGTDCKIKIYDRRESKIVRIFDGIHSGNIFISRYRFSDLRGLLYLKWLCWLTNKFLIFRIYTICTMEFKRRYDSKRLIRNRQCSRLQDWKSYVASRDHSELQ